MMNYIPTRSGGVSCLNWIRRTLARKVAATRRSARVAVGLVLALVPTLQPTAATTALAACANAIVCENQIAGTPSTTWDISGSGDPSIQGFATDISYNKGGTVTFKISTPAKAYSITIYRMGYYQGN